MKKWESEDARLSREVMEHIMANHNGLRPKQWAVTAEQLRAMERTAPPCRVGCTKKHFIFVQTPWGPVKIVEAA